MVSKIKRGKKMGFTNVRVLVCNPTDEERCQELEMLVDTGAALSVVPGSILTRIGIQPLGTRRFRAFGGVIERETGTVEIQYSGDRAGVSAVFGAKDDPPVLGVTALETLGYQVDPTTGELKPTELLLL
jgi:aspartyl protease family protein